MADPITLASLPVIIAGVQSGLQNVHNTLQGIVHEVHDASTKRGLTKLNSLFLDAQMGDFTEKDLERAKHYYAKIEAVALISQNQTMLNSLKEGLALLKTTLVVKTVLDRKHEIDTSNAKVDDSKRPAFDDSKEEDVIVETCETHRSASDEVFPDSSIALENQSSLATDRVWTKLDKAMKRQAMYCSVAVSQHLQYLQLVHHLRRKC